MLYRSSRNKNLLICDIDGQSPEYVIPGHPSCVFEPKFSNKLRYSNDLKGAHEE